MGFEKNKHVSIEKVYVDNPVNKIIKPLWCVGVVAFMENIATKTRYSDADLVVFKEVIDKKLAIAREELEALTSSMSSSNPNGTDDTSGAYHTLEDGAATLEKESIHQLAARQKKFIEQLEAALVRIGNKTYGVCRETGELIQKERLLAVPHTTLSMKAKLKQN